MKRLLVAGLLLAVGCSSMRQQEKLHGLDEAIEGYNHAFRWKNYERAGAYLPSDVRVGFVATYEEDEKSLHVEDYRVMKVNLESEDVATVWIRVRYMLLPDVVVKNQTLTQHWARVNEEWRLESEDGSLREIDPSATPANPDAFGGPADPENEAKSEVQVTGPDGAVLRGPTEGFDPEIPAEEAPE